MTLFASLKLAYSRPRPIWVDPELKPWYCSAEFGNPSGHASTVTWFSFYFIFDLTRHIKAPVWIKIVASIFALVYAVLMSYSRVFLGAHSVDQVIFGSLIGTWAAFFSEFFLRDPITEEMTNLATNSNLNIKRRIILWAGSMLALMAILLF